VNALLNMLSGISNYGGFGGLPEETAGPGGIAGPVAAPPPGQGEDVVVTGDGWKPRPQTILGAIADAYLMSKGGKPMFTMMRDKRSMTEAMNGFTEDPLKAIRRIGKMDPDKAWDLFNQQQDNRRADQTTQRILRDSDERYVEHGLKRIGSMLGTANEKNWGALRERIQGYADHRGITLPYQLPETYDPDFVNTVRMGEVPVDNQLDNERDAAYKSERLEDYDEGLNIRRQQEEGRNARSEANRAAADRRAAAARQLRERLAARRGQGKSDDLAGAPKPRKPGDKIKSPSGQVYISKDGKSWTKG
jgi:hypothetical protein